MSGQLKFWLLAPAEEKVPTPTPDLWFDEAERAWARAARSVAEGQGLDSHATQLEVISGLLSADEVGVCYGWQVVRWAKTVSAVNGGNMPVGWNGGIVMHSGGEMGDTFDRLVAGAVDELVDAQHGLDVTVLTGQGERVTGILSHRDGDDLVMVDGHVINVAKINVRQIALSFGAIT